MVDTETVPFSWALREGTAKSWDACQAHPFVNAIGDGTLDSERFRFFLSQDYLFLVEYARFLAIATARAPGLREMERLSTLLQATLHVEMDLHRGYCSRNGVSAEALSETRPARATHAYTRHLLATAYGGSFGESMAAVLPCQWGYAEIGRRLAQQGKPAALHLAEWIEMYSGAEFQELAAWLCGLVDGLGADASTQEQEKMRDAFTMSCRYELAFWNMAWRIETWPAPGG